MEAVEVFKQFMSGELNYCNASDYPEQWSTGKRALCPNIVMNERHKMARNCSKALQPKLFRTPAELKFVAAKKAIRIENLKKMLREKESRTVDRAINQVKREFSNRRHSATLSLPDVEQQKKQVNANTHEIQVKELKLKEHADFLTDIQKAYKGLHENFTRAQNITKSMPDVLEATFQKNKNESPTIKLSPVTPKEMGNKSKSKNKFIYDAPDKIRDEKEKENKLEVAQKSPISRNNPDGEKKSVISANEMNAEKCGKQLDNVAEQSCKWILLYYWKVWRKVTLESKKQNYKLSKIDSFLTRLTKAAEQVQTLQILAETVSRQNAQKMLAKRKSMTNETEETRKLKYMEKEAIESSMEAYENLQKNLKRFHPKLQPRAKAISVLANAKAKYKITCSEPKRVYPTPTFLTEMESRYIERKKRWENIRKRKAEMEAEKEKIMKEREEEAKKVEDLKKKEKLEEIKEKRRREKEMKQERERERRTLKEQLKKADEHYNRYLMKRVGFQSWIELLRLRRIQMNSADHHSKVQTYRRFLLLWRQFTNSQLEQKNRKAQEFYDKILMRNGLHLWLLQYEEYVHKTQVSVDWADAKRTEKIFKFWYDHVRKEQCHLMHRIEIAESYHEGKILSRCLKKWTELPELMRNEKEKEKRKKLWQRKVQEFLPDYQPSFISEI